MLFECWSTIYDAGPTLKRHWVNVSCLLDIKNMQMCFKCSVLKFHNTQFAILSVKYSLCIIRILIFRKIHSLHLLFFIAYDLLFLFASKNGVRESLVTLIVLLSKLL